MVRRPRRAMYAFLTTRFRYDATASFRLDTHRFRLPLEILAYDARGPSLAAYCGRDADI